MLKQCQFEGIKDGQIFVQPVLFNRGLEKRAEVLEMRSKLHPKIKDFVSAIRPTSSGIYVLVNALGASEYWSSNANGDAFSEKSLIHAPSDWDELLDYPERASEVGKAWPYGYPTFMGASPFKHHANTDASRAFGKVELATWNPKMHRVELVIYLDRALCKKFDALDVIERMENGEYADLSMGCKVPYDRCSICQHKSKTLKDYCFPPGTPILLSDGQYKAIEEIRVDDVVVSHTGKDRKVTHLLPSITDENLIKIDTFGFGSIKSTPNHPFFVARLSGSRVGSRSERLKNSGPEWVAAEDIEPKDTVFLPIPTIYGDNESRPIAEFGWLLGFYLAEGSPFFSKNAYYPYGVKFSTHLNEKFEDLIVPISKIFDESLTYRISGYKDRNGKEISINSREIAEWLLLHGGRGSKTKVLNPAIWQYGKNFARKVLLGWAQGDGSLDKKKKILRVATSSEDLARQMQLLAAGCGVQAGIKLYSRQTNFAYQDIWYVTFCGDAADAIYEERPQLIFEQQNKLFFYENYLCSTVRAIKEEPYSGIVYNFEVEEDHSYVAGNFAVHNCIHAKELMNKILPDGRKVMVYNDFPKFFDISFVFIGADKTAKVLAKLAQKGNQICLGDYCTVPRLSAEVGEVFSKEARMDGSMGSANIAGFLGGGVLGGYLGHKAGKIMGEKSDEFYQKQGIGWKGKEEENRKKMLSRLSGVSGALLGSVLGHLATDLPEMLRSPKLLKTADPIDELPSNNGYSKEKAIEETSQQAIKLAPASQRWRTMKEVANSGPAEEADKIDQPPTIIKSANDPIKKKINFNGVPVWLEWLKGETREYKKDGKVKYKRLMAADYGYIPGTLDSDGEELDVYIGPDKSATNAYVIRQLKKTGGFDEHKVMIGYSTKSDAKASYIHHMGGTPERFGGIQSLALKSLVTLFGDNKKTKEKTACSCHGIGDDCGGSTEKLASLLFPVSKSASHAKLSEIIKSIPAGPFSRETLPKLEKIEKDIPNDILNMMGGMSLGSALSTPTMAGMILKPREFQRIILISIGEMPLADDLDSKNMTFKQSDDTDTSIPIEDDLVSSPLMNILSSLGLIKGRSAVDQHLRQRAIASKSSNNSSKSEEKISTDPVMKKIAAAYQGYRYNVLRKAASISNYMTNNPQLRSELFGFSMAQAFAGGIDKVSSASVVLSPDSLAYLMGAFTNRDQLLTNEVVTSLALTGIVSEAA